MPAKHLLYVEAEDKEPFDWKSFLGQRGYTELELTEAVSLASSWVTCACGNQCSIIPRDPKGSPRDMKLKNHGLSFYVLIQNIQMAQKLGRPLGQLQRKALECLELIEKRSAEILAEIGDDY